MVHFISYGIIAAVFLKIETNHIEISYEDLMGKSSGISEVVLIRKGRNIYRWTTVSQEMQKLLKSFNVLSPQA